MSVGWLAEVSVALPLLSDDLVCNKARVQQRHSAERRDHVPVLGVVVDSLTPTTELRPFGKDQARIKSRIQDSVSQCRDNYSPFQSSLSF